jgi:hypothetical protein
VGLSLAICPLALMMKIQKLFWLCSDKKGLILLSDISQSKSGGPCLAFCSFAADTNLFLQYSKPNTPLKLNQPQNFIINHN